MVGRDTHIMFFKVPIMLCSNAQHHASLLEERGDIYPSNFMVNFRWARHIFVPLFHRKDKLWLY